MITENPTDRKSLSVLLIGNNPIELGSVYERLRESRVMNYISDIAFDLKDVLKKVRKINPQCIVIDDNLSKQELAEIMQLLKSNSRTKHIPITIIQNSNKDDAPRDGADEFILKDTITSESIAKTLLNSLKIHDMKEYLKKSYDKRKSQLLNFK